MVVVMGPQSLPWSLPVSRRIYMWEEMKELHHFTRFFFPLGVWDRVTLNPSLFVFFAHTHLSTFRLMLHKVFFMVLN